MSLLVDKLSPRALVGQLFAYMDKNQKAYKVAGTSPTIKRSHPVTSTDTCVTGNVGVPRIQLKDIKHQSFVVSLNHELWYKFSDGFINIKPCKIEVVDVLKQHNFSNNDCVISKCGTKNCKTCNILITDTSFTSNLTMTNMDKNHIPI